MNNYSKYLCVARLTSQPPVYNHRSNPIFTVIMRKERPTHRLGEGVNNRIGWEVQGGPSMTSLPSTATSYNYEISVTYIFSLKTKGGKICINERRRTS